MSKRTWLFLALFASLALAAALPAAAQVDRENIPTPEDAEALPEADADAKAIWFGSAVCALNRPSEVQGYDIRCTGANFLDAAIADCCIPGDHFQLKLKNWDRAPNTGVTTSPGPANLFGLRTRVYNYGGTPENPRNLHAYLECTYLHGVDIFGAGSFINLSSDGNCVVTADPPRSRIDRSP